MNVSKSLLRPLGFTLGTLLLGLTVSFSIAARAENLIENPGFESGTDGWVLMVPPGAEAMVSEPLATSTTTPHSGTSSGSMKSEGPARYGLSTKRLITVSPGERYRISAWVKVSDEATLEKNAPGVYLRATLLSASKTDVKTPPEHLHIGVSGEMVHSGSYIDKLSVTELPKGWRKIEGVVEIPEEVAYISTYLFSHGITGTVCWDDVSVEKVPASTPLSKDVSK